MTRMIGIVLGDYGIIAFAVALLQLVMKLKDCPSSDNLRQLAV